MWQTLKQVKASELDLFNTFKNGQCFNWTQLSHNQPTDRDSEQSKKRKRTANADYFLGVIKANAVLLTAEEVNDEDIIIKFMVLNRIKEEDEKQVKKDLLNFLQLEQFDNLASIYKEWSTTCKQMRKACAAIPGLRILKQDPLECLFSFICSSNNNIARITSLVTKLRTNYGTKIPLDEEIVSNLKKENGIEISQMFQFPSVQQLTTVTEAALRELGFGYRAKYIVATANLLKEKGGEDFLLSLRIKPEDIAEEDHVMKTREVLEEFTGVGRKVADCVALFSLDALGVVPVDTHVKKIANKFYGQQLKTHEDINRAFRQRFGPLCGWAHSVLFAADLPVFSQKILDRKESKDR